ncbi:MAG: exosome complex protein Rrp42 [Candidatus Aenigmatarchaeota archaeon]
MRSEYILKLLEKNERLDGRKLDEFRNISVEVNPIERAEGSARVKFGKTDVIVGVKMDFGEPYPDSPKSGVLRTEAELVPLAHPEFVSGPPDENATEIARVIDRGIREGETIDLEKLCITEGEKVWCVYVDFYPLNHDGNLIDAGSLAALVALKNTKIPSVDEKGKIDRTKLTEPLQLLHQPITITVGKVGGKYIIDPTYEEEEVLDSKLSVAVTEEGKVVAMQKGPGILTDDDVDRMIDIAVEKSKEIRELILGGTKEVKQKTKANKSRKG